ncbi:conserved protein of unknown function [Burkholderia multivorans]
MAIHAHEVASDRLRLNVRANLYCMRVTAVWQVLMPIARNIENVTISIGQPHGCAEIMVSFPHMPRDLLQAMADRLGKMSWVTDAALC